MATHTSQQHTRHMTFNGINNNINFINFGTAYILETFKLSERLALFHFPKLTTENWDHFICETQK